MRTLQWLLASHEYQNSETTTALEDIHKALAKCKTCKVPLLWKEQSRSHQNTLKYICTVYNSKSCNAACSVPGGGEEMDPPAHRTSNLKSTTVLKAVHNAPAKKPTYLTQQLPLRGNPAQGGRYEFPISKLSRRKNKWPTKTPKKIAIIMYLNDCQFSSCKRLSVIVLSN